MKKILEKVEGAIARGETVAVATIARTRGSTPRERGAKMIVAAGGNILGTIGGGCGEADVWRAALDVIEDRRPRMVHVDLTEEIDLKSEGVCGGTLDVYVEPWGPDQGAWLRSNGDGLLDAAERNEAVALCTVIERTRPASVALGEKMLVAADGRTHGTLGRPELDRLAGADAAEALRTGEGRVATYPWAGLSAESTGSVEVLIEVQVPAPTLLILGAGHIAVPLARIAKQLDFHVTVVDDRVSFANRERFPDADDVIAADFEQTVASYPVGPRTYCILITRGHSFDVFALRRLIHRECAYIGMIGSQRRVWAVYKLLHDEGVSPDVIGRVHAPIGIDIGAETPAEIAISILAEVVKVRRGGTALSLSDRLRDRYVSRLSADEKRG